MNITIVDDDREPDGQPIHAVPPDLPEHEAASIEPLILDLLEWIGPGARPYDEVIDAWRTSCPRLPVWEEACARGYLIRQHVPGGVAEVEVSEAGRAHIRATRA